MGFGIGKKMSRPVEYVLDRKYIGFAVKLFHGAKNFVEIVLLNNLSVGI